MKRIEKEIKKDSTQRIESSLPEINSLDNIPTQTKKPNRLPLFLIPVGIVAAIVVAVVVPLSLKRPMSNIKPQPSGTINSSITGYSNQPYNPGSSANPINTNHTYNYNLGGYVPAFNSFNELAYYSYLAYNSQDKVANNALYDSNKLMAPKDEEDDGKLDEKTRYVDKYGRTHYAISQDGPFTFSNFLFFEFDTVDSAFLEQRIGNGHIRGVSLSTNIFGEEMLILKNGENYYSCLINGGGSFNHGQKAFKEFSAHKTIEGFDVVKDATNKRYLTLYFGGTEENALHIEELESISIEGYEFSIDPSTVVYDNISVNCTVDELRELLELNPDFKQVDDYGGTDELVYDSTIPETSTFTLDEFVGTFTVAQDELYLDETKILDLNGASKLYASEINKDAHRELVFETYENSRRMIVIYDIEHREYLYRKIAARVNDYYDCYLDMMDQRLAVKLYEPGHVEEDYLIDYGYYGYFGRDGIAILWQNYFEIAGFRLNRVLEIDGETLVPVYDDYYSFKSNAPYIVEIQMTRYGVSNNDMFSNEKHLIGCKAVDTIKDMPNQSPDWDLLSAKDGIYQYQIKFQESGYSVYQIYFNRYSFALRAAVDVEFVDQLD